MLTTTNQVLSPQIPERAFMFVSTSGTIDTEEELEVFANVVGAGAVLAKDADEGPRCYYARTSYDGDTSIVVCVTIGQWVSWTITRPLTDAERDRLTSG